jgi:hypothetical protein
MSNRKLHQELKKIDEALAVLEERRTNIINRLSSPASLSRIAAKILNFPNKITVTDTPPDSADLWPRRF